MSRLVLVLNLIGWKKWRELSGPVTRQGKVKLKPFRITFDTQLKLALKEVLFLQSLRENDFRVFAFHIAGCLIEVWLVITNLKQNQYQLKLQHHGHRHRWHHQVNKTNNIKNTNDYSIIIMITIIINSNNKTSLSWKITTISFFLYNTWSNGIFARRRRPFSLASLSAPPEENRFEHSWTFISTMKKF